MRNLIIWAVVLGVLGYGGAKLYLHHEVSDAMDKAVLMVSPYAKLQYDGVSSTMSGELTVDGVRIRVVGFRDDIYIDSLGINTPSFLTLLQISDFMALPREGLPDYMGFMIDGLRMPVTADYYQELYDFSLEAQDVKDSQDVAAECTGKYGFSPKALAGLGYSEQVVSMSFIVRDDDGKFSMDIDMGLQDMWDMYVNVTLAGSLTSGMLQGAGYRPKLNDLRLEYTDRSLNQRIVTYCSERGLSPEAVLKAQVDAFKYTGESNGIVFDEYMLDPYMEFLGGKSTLVITAKPSEPIAFSQIDLYKPSDVPALLNLAATAR